MNTIQVLVGLERFSPFWCRWSATKLEVLVCPQIPLKGLGYGRLGFCSVCFQSLCLSGEGGKEGQCFFCVATAPKTFLPRLFRSPRHWPAWPPSGTTRRFSSCLSPHFKHICRCPGGPKCFYSFSLFFFFLRCWGSFSMVSVLSAQKHILNFKSGSEISVPPC